MKHITSLINSDIKHVVELHDSKGRKQHKQFIAEGIRTIETFIRNGWPIETLYVTSATIEEHRGLVEQCPNSALVSADVMQKMSPSMTPSGLLALFAIPSRPLSLEILPGLVLARIQDPGNMGTLIRTAAALAVPNIIVVEGCDPYSPKVVQATAGALALVTVRSMSWETLLKAKKSLPLCALVVAEGDAPDTVDLANSLVVVGSEAHGIPQEWLTTCEQRVTLPMPGNMESLNAAIAGSIALYLRYQQKVKTDGRS